MYQLAQIEELHLELTERCNAHCPMCGRFQENGQDNPQLNSRELSLSDIQRNLPKEFVRQLSRVRLCGNFGDPAAAQDCLAICEHLLMLNPALSLSLHSNGGLRDEEWWFQLGRHFRKDHDEIFIALDGLEETLPIYRRGVRFERVFRNACAAIRGGARVHWVMLVFQHNEHEVDLARDRAKQAGFSSFRLKSTKRFLRGESSTVSNSWPVFDEKSEQKLYEINPPTISQYVNPVLEGRAQVETSAPAEINCHVVNRRSLYLSAAGLVFPCCWTAGAAFSAERSTTSRELKSYLDRAGGIVSLDFSQHSLKQIVEGPLFQDLLPSAWIEGGPIICARTCNAQLPAFRAQFIERTDFSSTLT